MTPSPPSPYVLLANVNYGHINPQGPTSLALSLAPDVLAVIPRLQAAARVLDGSGLECRGILIGCHEVSGSTLRACAPAALDPITGQSVTARPIMEAEVNRHYSGVVLLTAEGEQACGHDIEQSGLRVSSDLLWLTAFSPEEDEAIESAYVIVADLLEAVRAAGAGEAAMPNPEPSLRDPCPLQSA